MTKETKDIMKLIGMVFLALLIIALIGVGALITIWSINTVFMTSIVYNFWTWLGMVWLSVVTFGGVLSQLRNISNKL